MSSEGISNHYDNRGEYRIAMVMLVNCIVYAIIYVKREIEERDFFVIFFLYTVLKLNIFSFFFSLLKHNKTSGKLTKRKTIDDTNSTKETNIIN